ncbi:alkaline phosphatase D family protein [uncultured Xylophilus sp.]|uniref:alkaline phosphatase D family protein n=1 Tax=uncultured Xylophilus sp. TaxID=296832 RepID=UPI0025F7A8EB|nr:alkaline phosphatase D family protein [uncultured Xylophilus sp.]
MDRRLLLRLAFAAATGSLPVRWARSAASLRADPFACGVASGAPDDRSVVLWTRVANVSLPSPDATAAVRWEIADDVQFRRIVRAGVAAAVPALGHAVHVEAGGLAADRWYFYRFHLGDATSPVGRTRTFPAPDVMAARLRFAFASCQRWEHGYYAAWRHVADEHPDLVVFLGDYIYEYASPRKPDPSIVRSHTLHYATTLADYRDRYALYKSDPDLQRAHRACPWIATWDDHEVQNDYAGDVGQAETPGAFLMQRSAAYQAFYENMPLRTSALVRGLAGLGQPDGVRVHSRYAFGRLAQFHLLDTRQYRDVQACRDMRKSSSGAVRADACAALSDPTRTLLGTGQEQWLDAGLQADAAGGRTRWSVIAQQTLFSSRNYGADGGPVPTDGWDGYPAGRDRLLASLQRNQPANTVFIGGDIHQNFVCDVHADVAHATGPRVATEFCGTSITSLSGASQERLDALVRRNLHIHLAISEKRGYGWVEVTPARWDTTLRVVDDARQADSDITNLARFRVDDGIPGATPIS